MPDWFPYPIRYVGDCGISGRGYSMRGYLAALRQVGVTRAQIDIMPWPPTMALQEDWFFDDFLRLRDDKPDFDSGTPRVNIIDARIADAYQLWTKGWHNIIVAPWTRLPMGAVPIINRCDEVWATTERAAAALREAGITLPIYVIPRPVQLELLVTPPKHVAPDIAPEVHPHFGPHEFKHTSPVYFYYVGSLDRKNVDLLLKAYFAVGWGARDPVELLLHSSPRGAGDAVVHGEIMQRYIDQVRPPGDAPIVRPLSCLKPYSWVCKLHQMNHVFVSADLDESLAPWEAAAVGNMVVVPDCVEPIPGALTFGIDIDAQFKVAFDLMRAGWLGTEHAHQARERVSPESVAVLLKQRLTALKVELDGGTRC